MENRAAGVALRLTLLFPLLVTAAGRQQNEQCPEILSKLLSLFVQLSLQGDDLI